ncbi:uncharacterized protein LOC127251649 isoform X2 [Andrographis paniculata]|uniref:uncharacterized protein LOC127251649 isoform X2 n=1 Tax=Andrographis paniculata TaxID=175694 RepID=UPI0021E87C64|nr:uncharacterized protein LOC127251649 isoform X2 [Andrographis paniculata]
MFYSAMAVSGGPDSIALCILTAGWKFDYFDAETKGSSKSNDGLLAIVVDHRLRAESAEEANLVHNRITDMGINCEVVHCEWLNGRPKAGHLQEAARNKRYETLRNVCIQRKIDVLMVAQHADDQAELFILRLSRNSGVLGLAGMAFVSQMFHEFPDLSENGSETLGILLVRPLLDFSKQDLYNICQVSKQQWVEDPTNRSPMYARNRIRMSLSNLSSMFKGELQAVVSACQRARSHVDKVCHRLLSQAVTIVPHGYAVIDLGILNSMEIKDIYLAKFSALVLQFISQRHRPVRGNASKLLLSYFRTFPCKACLTVAGCYLCPAPGSKGTKALVCCSVNSALSLEMKMFPSFSHDGRNCSHATDLEQIIAGGEAYEDRNMPEDRNIPDASGVPFLDLTSSETILDEAERIGILSHSTHKCILSLQKEENAKFKSKPKNASDIVSEDDLRSEGATLSKLIYPGQVGYFMNRFVLNWKEWDTVLPHKASCTNYFVSVKGVGAERQCCISCTIGGGMAAEVRNMIDADWIYLTELSKISILEGCELLVKSKQLAANTTEYAILSAHRALASLKSIPAAARRTMPVLVNAEGTLLSIPSIGFSCCPDLMVSADFKPRTPLGGGHSSFL